VDIRLLIPELFEKLSLIATAGLLGVLVPPLRNRLLGVGQPRDIAVVVIFGLLFSLWGSTMGFEWLGHHLNLRAIGIIIAGILGGPRAGAVTGLLGGGFYVTRVAGSDPIQALPSLAAQLAGVAVGVALFINVALVVISRQEQAVALVEAQAAANALSLTALRSRLEPHFLFNALNTLRATIRRDPEQARNLVSDLADLYRYLLHHPHDASVMNEVEHACAYLAIERARLGDERLAVQTSIDESVRDARIPALLLQPIVENAVKHGITPKEGLGRITIRASKVGNRLRIEVEDEADGPHRGPSTQGSGLALQTLRKRLDQQYDGKANLRLSSLERGTLATVELPMQPAAKGEPA
jgi:LytS/YehU family sensor histidine kinase